MDCWVLRTYPQGDSERCTVKVFSGHSQDNLEVFSQLTGSLIGSRTTTWYANMTQAIKKTSRNVFEKWQAWLALLALILAIIGGLLDLPKKLSEFVSSFAGKQQGERIIEQPLSGSIRDETNEPLAGVQVSLAEFGITVRTDRLGRFQFQVKAPHQASVELLAQKDGYQTHEQYASLGNTRLSFTMRRKD